jgi:Tol biopolymer transport system component
MVSPDGLTLAYKAMQRPGFEADRFWIKLRDLATGKVTTLAADWDRSADAMKWSRDGKSLYVVAGDVGRTKLFRIDVRKGTVTTTLHGRPYRCLLRNAQGLRLSEERAQLPLATFRVQAESEVDR